MRTLPRYYASPSDDDNGRTWDVLDRQRFTDAAFVVEQCLPTRTAARAAARRWNMEDERAVETL